jgi:hypothetical protein
MAVVVDHVKLECQKAVCIRNTARQLHRSIKRKCVSRVFRRPRLTVRRWRRSAAKRNCSTARKQDTTTAVASVTLQRGIEYCIDCHTNLYDCLDLSSRPRAALHRGLIRLQRIYNF